MPKETAPHFCGGWCSRYLFSRLGQSIVLPWCSAQRIIIIMIAGGNHTIILQVSDGHLPRQKKASIFRSGLVFTMPGFTVRATILCRLETCRWHVSGKEKTSGFLRRLVFALPIFTVRATILCLLETCRWHVSGKEKSPHFCGGWCSRYLFSRLGQAIVLA